MKNTKYENCKNLLNEVINELNLEIEVNDELIYSIFGDNLDVENTKEDIIWMFTMEL